MAAEPPPDASDPEPQDAGPAEAQPGSSGAAKDAAKETPKEQLQRKLKERFASLAALGQTVQRGSAGKRSDRFDKFTERAKKVLTLAQEEAQRFNHNYIGTEHLLLGLVREGAGIGAKSLTGLGVELDQVRAAVEYVIGRGDKTVTGPISLTPRAKKVIELAIEEARSLNHSYVGTEHLLLGMIREGEGIAAGVLESLGVTLADVPARVLQVLATHTPSSPPPMPTKDNVLTCRVDDADLAAIDILVEAGIRSTRSDAAQWLIHTGIAANKALFEKVEGTVGEIRRLRDEARHAAWQVTGDPQSLINTTPTEAPERPAKPEGEQAAG
jgi:hypothetical protein